MVDDLIVNIRNKTQISFKCFTQLH